MRCKSCDYPLWSIRARQCPECGHAFAPSEFEFAANAVEFRCPDCDQAYFGTGEQGHLVPSEFDCVNCSRRLRIDEMVLFPGDGVAEDITSVPVLPWLDKRKKWTAAWRVIGMAMTQPRRMMDMTPVESSIGRAWWFYTLVMLLVSILSGGGFFFVGIGFAGAGQGLGLAIVIGLGTYLAGLYAWPAIWGASAHGLMKLFRAEPKHTIGRTYQALCYSSGVMIPSAIPCIGFYLLPITTIWWMISAALAIPKAQGARAGRAAVAVILLPGLLYLGSAGFITWGFFYGMSMAASFNVGTVYANQVQLSMSSHVSSNSAWPDHGAALQVQATMGWQFLSVPEIDRTPMSFAGMTTWEWDQLSLEEQLDRVSALAEALPDNWAAHRLAHVVFTYNGIDPAMPQDPALWTFLYWPAPDDSSAWVPGALVTIMRADGMTEEIDQADFDTMLENQNALRAQHGLPALPHPSTVHEITLDTVRPKEQ